MTLRGGQSNGSIRTWRRHFPISSVDTLVDLIREILLNSGFHLHNYHLSEPRPSCSTSETNGGAPCIIEPDLAFVSIVLGFVENKLTVPINEESTASSKIKLAVAPSVNHSKSVNHSSRVRLQTNNGKIPPSPLSIHTAESPDATLELPSRSDEPEKSDNSASNLASGNTVNMIDDHSHVIQQGDTESPKPPQSRLRPSRSTRNRTSPQINVSNLALSRSLCSSNSESLSVPSDKRRRFSVTSATSNTFPCLTFDEAEKYYLDFYSLIMNSPKLQSFIRTPKSMDSLNTVKAPQFATRSLIRAVCEVLWSRMTSGKNKEKVTHTQSVYSFLTAGILDSFGLAYTTVAACQLLGYSDVDLTLSEDHGWVEFGPPDSRQSADVASWVHSMSSAYSHESSGCTEARLRSSQSEETDSSGSCRPDSLDSGLAPPPIRMPPWTHSWLYVNGCPVVCRPRILTVVAAVTALQPGASTPTSAPASAPACDACSSRPQSTDLITPSGLARHLCSSPTISLQLVNLKHRLLWLFYDAGCLARYPLGLTNLADLVDAFPTTEHVPDKAFVRISGPDAIPVQPLDGSTRVTEFESNLSSPSSSDTPTDALILYNEAVRVTQLHYCNQHVYPYTCLAGYHYRHGNHSGALRYWSEAAKVIGQYNHSSEDWEIYRELLDIATQLMPHMFRCASEASRSCSEGSVEADPDGCLFQSGNILEDPQCLAYLLAFYDHLCLWEEGSPVPVLHVGWVDKLMVNLARFSQRARRLLNLSVDEAKLIKKEESCYSPSSVHSKRSDHLTPVSPASSTLSLPKRVSRRTRTSSLLQDQQPPSTPSPTPNVDVSSVGALDTQTSTEPIPSDVTPLVFPPLTAIPSDDSPKLTRNTALTESIPRPNPKARKSIKNKKPSLISTVDDKPVTLDHFTHTESVYPPLVGSPSPEPVTKILPCSEVAEVLAGLYHESEVKVDPMADLEEQDASPSPPPIPELSNNDLLNSLVEACNQRLLNPAFLWGMEPNVPFLPPDVAPEDAFTRLLASLEPNAKTIDQQASLFPTPPNSGSLCETSDDTGISSNRSPTAKVILPVNIITDKTNVDELLFVESSLERSRKYDPVTQLNIMDVSDEVPRDVIDSVAGLVHDHLTPNDEYKPSDAESDFFEMILKTDESVKADITPKRSESSPRKSPLCVQRVKTMEELIVHLTLHSVKMISIIDLLRATRLNSSAIKLALTAQSQVSLRRSGLSSVYDV